ncbi:thiazole-phosphate synthase [[Leptolyngbya] sp. PCC 7376]|uniref:glycine oxidase ThiO n=1 Tax=[Leptolyngbya] sp. PCC 7376 TaxID=111781 RepID=UPI00029F1146|nr:glycine oxidase ThiO [[Leptolyngbya] sp. PCC 7376]AFY39610.1 thiazole-phosphate synthase [[Leptolyngbya] sp. PCC 7376]
MAEHSDILVLGGGIIGLSIAVELQQQGRQVTVLSRRFSEAASHAAAGMLAPQAEGLTGPMWELGRRSRDMYPEWSQKIEQLSGMEVGYLPCGIFAPCEETPANVTTPQHNGTWLNKTQLGYYQSNLGESVAGAWLYPEDGQVDNRKLTQALLQAAQGLGVTLKEGVTVLGLQQSGGEVLAVQTDQCNFTAEHYVLAAGSWSAQITPLPIYPVKGQMLALQMPTPDILRRVLFGDGIYLVPRQDGTLIVGATVEEVQWQPNNTPKGIRYLLSKAARLLPAIQDWNIKEFWWGYRPATPDEMPILGESPCQNLTYATGHYRNGILLTPVTAKLIGDRLIHGTDDPLLKHFSYQRFLEEQPMNNGSSATLYATPISTPTHTKIGGLPADDQLVIAGRTFRSRLMTGTGKYPSIPAMQQSVEASGCEIVTVAVRRVQTKAPGHEGLAEALDWNKIWMLPNTAGCKTAEEAIRVARLGREMARLLGQEDNNFVKLEVIPDAKYLLPDPIGTLEAAEILVKEGFAVLPYINADPLLAKRLEEVGCATVMPLGSPIGSGQGIQNEANIKIIIEQSNIPVVIDAGIGSPSEAAFGMEMGADALLINSAIALAQHPVQMGRAMGLAAEAGRLAYLAGRIPVKSMATASSPQTGTINS